MENKDITYSKCYRTGREVKRLIPIAFIRSSFDVLLKSVCPLHTHTPIRCISFLAIGLPFLMPTMCIAPCWILGAVGSAGPCSFPPMNCPHEWSASQFQWDWCIYVHSHYCKMCRQCSKMALVVQKKTVPGIWMSDPGSVIGERQFLQPYKVILEFEMIWLGQL